MKMKKGYWRRTLAMDPKIMLFDEPTSALDPEMICEALDIPDVFKDLVIFLTGWQQSL